MKLWSIGPLRRPSLLLLFNLGRFFEKMILDPFFFDLTTADEPQDEADEPPDDLTTADEPQDLTTADEPVGASRPEELTAASTPILI